MRWLQIRSKYSHKILQYISKFKDCTFWFVYKAELLQEGIFFLIHLFARDVLVMKKLEIEKYKCTFIIH